MEGMGTHETVITETLRKFQMRENAQVVDAVERCLKSAREISRRMDDLEKRMGAPNCPMCGRKR
jgi:hypothetical protein